jgi:arsenate reductase (thioredoxin)
LIISFVFAQCDILHRMSEKLKILFLCTGNSCRSQMAEGWTRHLKKDSIQVFSAGLEAHGLNSYAVRAMQEVGVDIMDQKSQKLEEVKTIPFDFVITLCGHADENCPIFSCTTTILHFGFDDPPKLAQNAKTEKEVLCHYRRVRDEIRNFIEILPEALS